MPTTPINPIRAFNAHFNFTKYVSELTDSSKSYYNSGIFKIIDRVVLEGPRNQFHGSLKAGTVLFRARVVSAHDCCGEKGLSVDENLQTTGFNEENSVEAQLYAPEGNNLNTGLNTGLNPTQPYPTMPYLYVSDDAATACAEVKPPIRTLISLAELEVCRDLSIIDFSKDAAFKQIINEEYDMNLGVFFTELMSNYFNRFTQVVSDYLRKSGIDGIAYKSFYTGKTNYVIYNSHRSNIRFKESRIVMYCNVCESFWDFNEGEMLKADAGRAVGDEKMAKMMLENISRTIENGKRKTVDMDEVEE